MERFDDGPVIINFLTGRYFALNPWADVIWTCLQKGSSGDQLLEDLSSLPVTQGLSDNQLQTDVNRFLIELIEQRLLASMEQAEASAAIDLLAMAPAHYEAPRVDIFDDLADLILLDPIHDVNASLGWPVAQKTTPDASGS
jgi:hypothetical protein